MQRIVLLALLIAVAEGFVATPAARVAPRAPVAHSVAAPTMVLEPSSIDAASSYAIPPPIPLHTVEGPSRTNGWARG